MNQPAAPAQAAPAPAAAPKPKKRGLLAKLAKPLIVIASLALIVFIRAGFLFILLGLLPSIIAYYYDDKEEKHLFKTVLSCNVAGMLPMLAPLMRPRGDPSAFLTLLMTPMAWLIVLASAAVGWVLVWICQYVTYAGLSMFYKSEMMFMESVQKRLLDEWGPQLKRREEK